MPSNAPVAEYLSEGALAVEPEYRVFPPSVILVVPDVDCTEPLTGPEYPAPLSHIPALVPRAWGA